MYGRRTCRIEKTFRKWGVFMSAMLKQKLIDIANGFTKYGLWKGGGSGGSSTLSEMTDVTLSNLQANDILKYNGSVWVNDDSIQNQINSITNGKGIISYAGLGESSYGVYRTNELTANNSPSGSDTDGILIVLPCIYSSQLFVQIFWGYNTKQVHMRICWYGSYQDWIKLSQ